MPSDHQHMKTWGATDFERYHQGKMPAAEMHALEKAALEDPFLQDALDGYFHTNNAGKELEAIRQRLPKAGVTAAPVIGIRQKRFYNFLKVAAVLLLFGGFAWLLNNNKEGMDQKNVTLAKTETKDNVSTEAVPPVNQVLADSVQAGDFAVVQDKSLTLPQAAPEYKATEGQTAEGVVSRPETANETAVAAAEAPVYPGEKVSDENAKRKEDGDAVSKPALANDALTARVAGVEAREQKLITGSVTDQSGAPVQGASVYAKDKNIGAQTDSRGRYVISTTDSVLNLTASAVGYDSKQQQVRTDDGAGNFVLEERDAAQNEVVVTSATGIKRHKKEESAAVAKSSAANTLQIKMPSNISLRNVYLVSGQTELIRFANDSLRTSPEKGSVELAFDTDEKGAPMRIKLVKPLCNTCDALAVKLLQQATWKKIKKGKKAMITVNLQ